MDTQKYILREDEVKEALPALKYLKAEREKVTEWDGPPGSRVERLHASSDCKFFLRRLSSTLYGLHVYCRKTVKGKLRMKNIWVTPCGDVKLKDVELCDGTCSNINATYHGLSEMLRDDLFHKGMPLDIQQWLKILESKKEDAYDRAFFIKCHPSIMTDRNKLELLMRIYKHLWPIKAKLRKLYRKLTRGLPYENDWKDRVTENIFLCDVYYDDKYGRTVYQTNITGLLRFLKNCDSHLHEKALPAGASEPWFQSWHLAPMIFGNIPLFIGAIAERLFEYNEYRSLEVEDLMA